MKLLDLFCGAGGASKGYMNAGFEVVGCDISKQKRYIGNDFILMDATILMELLLAGAEVQGYKLSDFDVIAASPPCQFASIVTPNKTKHRNYIPKIREQLVASNKPYVIENVFGAKKHLINPVMLCGTYFNLKVYRHRLFESNIPLTAPKHEPHRDNTPSAGHGISSKGFISPTSGGQGITLEMQEQIIRQWQPKEGKKPKQWNQFVSPKGFISVTGHFSQVEYAKFAMGIDWMKQVELSQAIPPAYTEYIGKQIMEYLNGQENRNFERQGVAFL